MNLAEITPGKGKRALIIGGTRSGKSTLMDMFIREMVRQRPHVQILLLDSKPRFRAEVERWGPDNRFGRDADRHYADWEAGPVIPGSVRVNIHADKPLARFWRPDDPCRVAIAQTDITSERARLLEIADDWYTTRSRGADRVLAVDELLDYYHRNTISLHSSRDVPLKVVRAGGERGFGALYGAQRPKRSASADHRRTFSFVPLSSALRAGCQVLVGHGYSPRHSATGRGRRRLRLPYYQNSAGRASGICGDMQADPARKLSFTVVRYVGGEE